MTERMQAINEVLDGIETHYGAQLPQIYREWAQRGYFDPRDQSHATTELANVIFFTPGSLTGVDLWRPDVIPGLIPFAKGGGGYWCFYLEDATSDAEPEIINCRRYETPAHLYAPNSISFIYRLCLEHAAGRFGKVQEARVTLSKYARRLAESGANHWAEHVHQLAAAEVISYQSPWAGMQRDAFITMAEVDTIIVNEFGQRYINGQVVWGSRPPMADLLARIEAHYGVPLPPSYCNWALNGYLNAYSPDYWSGLDVEWIPPEELLEYDFGGPAPIIPLVPFAFTAAGDHWCWHTDTPTDSGEFEVLYCWHDDGEQADVYAPNLAAFIYRQSLEFASGGFENSLGQIEKARDNLRLAAKRLEELHCPAWSKHLHSLAQITPFAYQFGISGYFGFMLWPEIEPIITNEFGERYCGPRILWGKWDFESNSQ